LIDFAPGLTGTITLGSTLVVKSGNGLIIDGPGARNLTISGNHACRVFDIFSAPFATFSGLTIADGQAPDSSDLSSPLASAGGGIRNTAHPHGSLQRGRELQG
jgi:hypothetical protein